MSNSYTPWYTTKPFIYTIVFLVIITIVGLVFYFTDRKSNNTPMNIESSSADDKKGNKNEFNPDI